MTDTKVTVTLNENDPRARFTWHGKPYRVVKVWRDDEGDVWVWAIRLTKQGRDFRRGDGVALTARSLWRFGDVACAKLATYVEDVLRDAEEDAERWRYGTVDEAHAEAIKDDSYRYRTTFVQAYMPLAGLMGKPDRIAQIDRAYVLACEWQGLVADPAAAAGHAADGWTPEDYRSKQIR